MDQAPVRHRRRLQRESNPANGESELTVYQIKLTPGPDVLRRGINPLGVLDELRELGETSIVTDPDQVPAARPDRPGAVLPVLDDHGQDRPPIRNGSAKRSFSSPKTARSAIERTGPRWQAWLPVRLDEAVLPSVASGRPPRPQAA